MLLPADRPTSKVSGAGVPSDQGYEPTGGPGVPVGRAQSGADVVEGIDMGGDLCVYAAMSTHVPMPGQRAVAGLSPVRSPSQAPSQEERRPGSRRRNRLRNFCTAGDK